MLPPGAAAGVRAAVRRAQGPAAARGCRGCRWGRGGGERAIRPSGARVHAAICGGAADLCRMLRRHAVVTHMQIVGMNLAGEGREGYPRSRCTRTGWPAAPGRPGSETPERREYNDKMDAIYLGGYLGVLLAVSVAVVSLSFVSFSALRDALGAGDTAAGPSS